MSRKVRLAASRSVTGSSASAWTSSSFFTSALAANSSSSLALAASRASKKVSWAPRNRFQRASSTSRGAGPAAFQSRIRSRYRPAVGPQSVEVGERLGLLGQPLLDRARALPLLLLLGEVRLARLGVRRPRAGEPLPQLVVGRPVDPGQRLPGLEQVAHPGHAVAPVRRRGELLGLGDDRLLLRAALRQLLGALGLAGLPLAGDHRAEGVQPTHEGLEVADGVGLGDLAADGLDRGDGLVRGELRGPDALLEEADLGLERGVPLGVEAQRLLGRALGVLADGTLAVLRPDEDGPVLGDTSPLVARHVNFLSVARCRIVGRQGPHARRGASGPFDGRATDAAPAPGTR